MGQFVPKYDPQAARRLQRSRRRPGSAMCSGQRYCVTNEALTDAKACPGHLAQQRDDDPGVERRQQIESAYASKDDERAGVRDDQLGERPLLGIVGIAVSTCGRSSSSDRSKYGTSWLNSRF
jgi:hypothetical protein